MKVPVSWLKEYVDFEDTIEGLADRLTFSGVEVEGIETIGANLAGLIVGEIREVAPHPNADRLSVCTVYDGEQEVQVVCGAPNCAPGGKHPFAPIGAVLPGDFKIKKAKLRGVESFGMLCAEDELGLSGNHDGLMVLDPDIKPGTAIGDVLGPPEVVLDLEITPNRPDCLSIIGIAREVAALYGTQLKFPEIDFEECETAIDSAAQVSVEDASACPRYVARGMRDVVIKPAPEWMRRRLELAGVRSISNIVDITNYVMIECGQPLHAFDHALLAEGRVIVRPAKEGEKITTLDDEERELETDMLVIADPEKALAVAGVMGGATSEIGDSTKAVLLESACFDSTSVRSTSKKLALASESSYRFARGVDCGGCDWASRRATSLLFKFAQAKVLKGSIDVYPDPQPEKAIDCSTDSVAALLGIEIATSNLIACFKVLGLEILECNEEGCRVGIPSFRHDLVREVDLAEEYARIYGLDNIPENAPHAQVVTGANDARDLARADCRKNLVALGLRETMNYTLLSSELLDTFALDQPECRVVLPHPISTDQSVLRSTLIPQMVESLARNHARQIKNARFFELGRVFVLDSDQTRQSERVSIGLMGASGRTGLDRFKPAGKEEMFVWIKGVVFNLLKRRKLNKAGLEPVSCSSFADGFSVEVHNDGQLIGRMGILAESVASQWRIQEPVALAEVELEPLLEHSGEIDRYEEISTQPAIERDMALVVDESIKHADIMQVIEKSAPDLLENVRLFDIFRGKGIADGSKSMAYALTYRAQDRTLTDEQANKFHEKIKSAVRSQLGVEIRE